MNAIVSKKPLRQVTKVQELLANEQARDQLAAVASKHMNPERMMRVVANAIRTTPKLQECNPMSFLGALMQCASLGLEPNTILGHAYLIPFDKKAKNDRTGKWEVVETNVQLIVGYKGLIDLARRSGHITSLSANIHYSDDELWDYEEGTEAKLRHRPGPLGGQKLHAYAIAKFKDGGHAYVVLPWSHVMKIRDGSQGWQQAVRYDKKADSPWQKHEDEMAKKTAIRALAKYLPLSVEFMDAMSVDESPADFGAFARDPSAGVAPTYDDIIDGDVAGEDDPAQITQTQDQTVDLPAQQQRETVAARREPEPQPVRQTTTHQAQPKAADDFDKRPSRHDKAPADNGQLPLGDTDAGAQGWPAVDYGRYDALCGIIIDELKSPASTVDSVMETYAEQIDTITSHPDLKKLKDRLNAVIDRARATEG
jgi:recombination protein RecT